MTEYAEERMMRGIREWRSEQPSVKRSHRRFIPPWHEDWEAKYDREYRELEPGEQFGSTFRWAA